MAETYKMINKDTLEITSTNKYQRSRKDFEDEIQVTERDKQEAQKRIDELQSKIAILDKEV